MANAGLNVLFALAALSLSPAAHAAAAMADPVAACTRAVTDYAFYRDELDVAKYASLFTEDAEISFGGRTYTGKPAIVAELTGQAAQRPRARLTRHVMSNIRVDRIDDRSAHGTVYLILYAGPPSADGSPSAIAPPAGVGVYDVTFRTGADGCKIHRSRLDVTFRPPPQVPQPRPGG